MAIRCNLISLLSLSVWICMFVAKSIIIDNVIIFIVVVFMSFIYWWNSLWHLVNRSLSLWNILYFIECRWTKAIGILSLSALKIYIFIVILSSLWRQFFCLQQFFFTFGFSQLSLIHYWIELLLLQLIIIFNLIQLVMYLRLYGSPYWWYYSAFDTRQI